MTNRYNQPTEGIRNWDVLLNENFSDLGIEVTEEVATWTDLPATTDVTKSTNGQWPVYRVDDDSVFVQVTDSAKSIVGGLGSSDHPLPPSHHESLNTGGILLDAQEAAQQVQNTIVAATSTGSYYYDATADFGQALNNAWSQAGADGGGIIQLPVGGFTGDTPIVPQASGVEIRGAGYGNRQDGSIDPAKPTVYKISGENHGFDLGGVNTGIFGCSVRGLEILFDVPRNATTENRHGWNLDAGGGAKWQSCLIERCAATGFHGKGWTIGGTCFDTYFQGIGAYFNDDEGLRVTGQNASYIRLVGEAEGNGGRGMWLSGHSLDVFVKSERNAGPGIGIGSPFTLRGHLVAELNDMRGIQFHAGGHSINCSLRTINNQAADDSGYEIIFKDGMQAFIPTLNVKNENGADFVNVQGKSQVVFGEIKQKGGGFNIINGKDVDFLLTPENLQHDYFPDAETNGSGLIELSLDSVYSQYPDVNFAVRDSVAGVNLRQAETRFLKDGDGDVETVRIQFQNNDGSVPGTGQVKASVNINPR